MGRYEEVRDRASEVMTQQAMANAAMQSHDVDGALEYAEKGVRIADDILEVYGDVGASYVVYCNASSFLFQLCSSLEEYHRAFLTAFSAIYTTCPYLSKRLQDETSCCLFSTQLMQLFISYREFVEEQKFLDQDNEIGQKAFDNIELIFQITYNGFDLMKKVAPDNQMVAPMSQILHQMEQHGFERYDECKDLDWQNALDIIYDNLIVMKVLDE